MGIKSYFNILISVAKMKLQSKAVTSLVTLMSLALGSATAPALRGSESTSVEGGSIFFPEREEDPDNRDLQSVFFPEDENMENLEDAPCSIFFPASICSSSKCPIFFPSEFCEGN